MRIVPITLKEANAFVAQHHRHHGPTVGHKFSIGLKDEAEDLIGVAIADRPVSRVLDDRQTLEINRLCTDGTRNACSKLYGACVRIAGNMGYGKVVTYILESDSGSSLKAAGFRCEGKAGGLEWTGSRRPKNTKQYPLELKQRWVKYLHNKKDLREGVSS